VISGGVNWRKANRGRSPGLGVGECDPPLLLWTEQDSWSKMRLRGMWSLFRTRITFRGDGESKTMSRITATCSKKDATMRAGMHLCTFL
jgi:hypothetical protein